MTFIPWIKDLVVDLDFNVNLFGHRFSVIGFLAIISQSANQCYTIAYKALILALILSVIILNTLTSPDLILILILTFFDIFSTLDLPKIYFGSTLVAGRYVSLTLFV